MKIPKGHCWVEGDNHSHSHDSNSFGPVSSVFCSCFCCLYYFCYTQILQVSRGAFIELLTCFMTWSPRCLYSVLLWGFHCFTVTFWSAEGRIFINLERFYKWFFPSKTPAEVVIRVAPFYTQLVLLFIQQAFLNLIRVIFYRALWDGNSWKFVFFLISFSIFLPFPDFSIDNLCCNFRQVAVGLIQGKATRIVWPPKRWQRLEKITCDERLELEGKLSISEEEKTGEHSIKAQVDKENGISTACRSYSLVDDSGSVTEFSCDLSSWPIMET